MDQQLLEAQKRLEEKRESLKRTEPGQISCPDFELMVGPPCPDCGTPMLLPPAVLGLDPVPYCPVCTARELEDRLQAEQAEKLARMEADKSRRITASLSRCGIGERFIGQTFDDYMPINEKARNVLQACREYVASFSPKSGRNLLMLGSPGTGKNMMAAIIGQEVIKRDFTFLHTTALKMVRRVKGSWSNSGDSEQEAIDSFVAPDLLAIDEIGVQFGTPTEQMFLTEIINERYEKRRPTILISNLTRSQLVSVMGERVIDRFYDDGSMLMIFDWESYRRKQQMRLAA